MAAASTSPSSPRAPSWVILGAVPRVSSSLDLSLALATPPRVSILTIAGRLFPGSVATPRNFPCVKAIDPSSGLLLLLHADQGHATGPTIVNRPGDYSFTWREFVPGYFVLDAASASPSAHALPEPELIMHPGNVGIIASPAGDGSYMVAELQPIIGGDKATLLCFSSDHGDWVHRSVRYPLPPRPLATNGVVSHKGRLWWVDLSLGLIACNPFAEAPVLDFVPLPPGKTLEFGEARGQLDRHRAVRISAGKLRLVDMYHGDRSCGDCKVSVWTLDDVDSAGEWTLEHEATFADIWAHPSYAAAGLRKKLPVLALVHPKYPYIVYFFLEERIFGVDLRDHSVVDCVEYELVAPPREFVATRFVHAWELPTALYSSD